MGVPYTTYTDIYIYINTKNFVGVLQYVSNPCYFTSMYIEFMVDES